MPAGFIKRTRQYVHACNTLVLARVGRYSAAERSTDYEKPFATLTRLKWPEDITRVQQEAERELLAALTRM